LCAQNLSHTKAIDAIMPLTSVPIPVLSGIFKAVEAGVKTGALSLTSNTFISISIGANGSEVATATSRMTLLSSISRSIVLLTHNSPLASFNQNISLGGESLS